MSKRFGRNSRRRYREMEAERDFAQRQARTSETQLGAARERFEQELVQARTAKDIIRINWDYLSIFDRQAHGIRAEFIDIPGRHESLHSAIDIDHYDLVRRQRVEREHFVIVLGRKFAEFTLSKMTAK